MDAAGGSGRTATRPVVRSDVPEWAAAATFTASVPATSKLPLWTSVRVAEVPPAEMFVALAMVRFGTVVTGMKLDMVALFRKVRPSSPTPTVTVAPPGTPRRAARSWWWTPKRETARKVKRRISAVMKWAVAQGYRAAAAKSAITRRFPYGEVALATVRASSAWASTKRIRCSARVTGADRGLAPVSLTAPLRRPWQERRLAFRRLKRAFHVFM